MQIRSQIFLVVKEIVRPSVTPEKLILIRVTHDEYSVGVGIKARH